MRNITDVDTDLRALGRPMHPGVACVTRPALIAAWRSEVCDWRTANPEGEARYCALLEEREAIEADAIRARAAVKQARELEMLPAKVRHALASPWPEVPFGKVDLWLSSERAWLVLAGSTGAGKSVAAGHALVRAAAAGKSVAWADAAGFAREVGSFAGQELSERLKHVDVLALDDLGAEHMTPFAASVLFEVLHHRHEDGRRTIITTNLEREQLRDRLGPRLADRVANDCHFVVVTGESLRGGR